MQENMIVVRWWALQMEHGLLLEGKKKEFYLHLMVFKLLNIPRGSAKFWGFTRKIKKEVRI